MIRIVKGKLSYRLIIEPPFLCWLVSFRGDDYKVTTYQQNVCEKLFTENHGECYFYHSNGEAFIKFDYKKRALDKFEEFYDNEIWKN